MKLTRMAGAVSAVALSLGASVSSADAADFGYYATIYGTTDYVFRGLSYNEENPVPQIDFGVTYGDFHVGTFSSITEYLDTYGPWEWDFYAGFTHDTGPISWDFTAWYYMYGVEDPTLGEGDLNYFELTGKATYQATDKLTLALFGAFTPEQDIAVTNTQTIEGHASYALPEIGKFTPTLSGLIGFTNSDIDGYWLGRKEYTYWNAGADFAIDKFDFDFRYWDTNIDSDLADSRFVFTATMSMP